MSEASADPCRFVEVMEIVGGKWRGTILHCLSLAPRRFNELRRLADPITPKVLSQEIRSLEHDGLVSEADDVGYLLTSLGQTLIPVIEAIDEWRVHYPEVVVARQRRFEGLHDG